MRVEMIREVMSTRSSERPRMRNSQLSSRLMVASASPNTIAERSRTKRNSECGPYRRAMVRCWGSALCVTLSDSQISADSTSRAPRAFSRAEDSAPTIELGLLRSKARVASTRSVSASDSGVGDPISASRLAQARRSSIHGSSTSRCVCTSRMRAVSSARST
jgi:hypothetical protein